MKTKWMLERSDADYKLGCVRKCVKPGDSEALPLLGQSDSTPEAGG